jgi:hypothetical protein
VRRLARDLRGVGLSVAWVVGVGAALLRLAGAVPVEAHDEWQVGDRGCLRA